MVTQAAAAHTQGSRVFGLDELLALVRDHDGEGSRRLVQRLRWRLGDSNRNPPRFVGWKDVGCFGHESVGCLYHTLNLWFDQEGRLAAKVFKGEGGLELEVTLAPSEVVVLSTDEEIEAVFGASMGPSHNGVGARTVPKPQTALLMAMRHRPKGRSFNDYLNGG